MNHSGSCFCKASTWHPVSSRNMRNQKLIQLHLWHWIHSSFLWFNFPKPQNRIQAHAILMSTRDIQLRMSAAERFIAWLVEFSVYLSLLKNNYRFLMWIVGVGITRIAKEFIPTNYEWNNLGSGLTRSSEIEQEMPCMNCLKGPLSLSKNRLVIVIAARLIKSCNYIYSKSSHPFEFGCCRFTKNLRKLRCERPENLSLNVLATLFTSCANLVRPCWSLLNDCSYKFVSMWLMSES